MAEATAASSSCSIVSYVLSRSCRVRVRARVRVRVRARVSVRVRARVSVRVRVRAQPLLQAVQLRLEGGDALAALRLQLAHGWG